MSDKIFYFVLLDTDINCINDLTKSSSVINFFTFGNLRTSINSNMPIAFDHSDAINIANRTIDTVKKDGTCSNKKCYPVFGAVLVKLSVSISDDMIITYEQIPYKNDGKRDYDKLIHDDKLVIYNANGKNNTVMKRGILPKSLFNDVELISIEYVISDNDPKGWAILNSFDCLTPQNILLLKYAFDTRKEIKINNKLEILDKDYNNKTNKSPAIMLGGNIDYSNMTEKELRKILHDHKKLYLKLKSQQIKP